MNLTDVASFVALVDHGTITEAAAAEGVPKSTISRRVARLEEALGVQLLSRSSRAVSVTPQGLALHARAKPGLETLSDAYSGLAAHLDEPRGTLVLSAPHDVARAAFFAELLSTYRQRHPAVVIDARLASRYVDLVAEGIDVALRGHGEEIPGDPTLMAKSLRRNTMGMFASRAYLEAHGDPKDLQALSNHNLIAHHAMTRRPQTVCAGTEVAKVDFTAPVAMTNDLNLVHELARRDNGIALLPVDDDDLAQHLIRVLPRWSTTFGQLSLVWPATRYLAPRVRAFIDLAAERLTSHGVRARGATEAQGDE